MKGTACEMRTRGATMAAERMLEATGMAKVGLGSGGPLLGHLPLGLHLVLIYNTVTVTGRCSKRQVLD